MSNKCPLTGATGEKVSERSAQELADAYQSYLGKPIPDALRHKYFTQPIVQYQSRESGLRWFSPKVVGEGDLYKFLGLTFDWYYEDSWDKFVALKFLKKLKSPFLDVGCGNGNFLRLAKRAGLSGMGIDLNPEAVAQAQADGLQVHLESAVPRDFQYPPVLCLFQTLEHVPDPLAFLKSYIDRTQCKTLIVSVPCFETLLGYTRDPLSWPPHHITFWSEKALRTLGDLVHYRVVRVAYQELPSYKRFKVVWGRENGKPLPDSSLTLQDNPWASRIHFYKSRLQKKHWACRAHSILVQFERC